MPDDVATLAEQHEANLARARVDRNLAFSTYPQLFHPVLLPPCKVRILMVADDGIDYSTTQDFGLGDLLDALAVSPGPYVQFAVTKAHRSTGQGVDPGMDNFVFSTATLAGYDQLWLFGVLGGDPEQNLTADERTAIARFMDDGGGVFATGDHEDLGLALCGAVPRVRSMRKWWFQNPPPPPGFLQAPPVLGLDRHDTLQRGFDDSGGSRIPDTLFHFDDQSDDVPQPLEPKMYTLFGNIFFKVSYPHPLLCGPRGVIRILPDHMHEGECLEDVDLTRRFQAGDYDELEFPGGLRPEIIAWSRVIGRSQAEDVSSGAVNARRFGAISAYDGHRVGVGRVSVDATWHHFLNLNLTGAAFVGSGPDAAAKQAGFPFSAEGQAAFEDIKAYFRNLGVWLAPPAKQLCMLVRILWTARWINPANMVFVGRGTDLNAEGEDVLLWGAAARDSLGRVAPQCLQVSFLPLILRQYPLLREPPLNLLDPWHPDRSLEESERLPTMDRNVIVDAVLGGALRAIVARYPDGRDDGIDTERLEEDILAAASEGATIGLRRAATLTERATCRMQQMVTDIGRAVDQESPEP
jgi:hypothetical protein